VKDVLSEECHFLKKNHGTFYEGNGVLYEECPSLHKGKGVLGKKCHFLK
jgi:hypothetical protein